MQARPLSDHLQSARFQQSKPRSLPVPFHPFAMRVGNGGRYFLTQHFATRSAAKTLLCGTIDEPVMKVSEAAP